MTASSVPAVSNTSKIVSFSNALREKAIFRSCKKAKVRIGIAAIGFRAIKLTS